MGDSPESVVRKFVAAWAEPKADELVNFLAEDAVWVDGPQGVRRGADAVVDELVKQLSITAPSTIEISTLVANGGTVMVEWHGRWTMGDKPIYTTVMAAFEVDGNGRIKQMRESYDLKSVMDQIEAAGYTLPG